MIKEIKEIANKQEKKMGKESILKIKSILLKEAEKIIKEASRKSDFSGRKTIKPEDIGE